MSQPFVLDAKVAVMPIGEEAARRVVGIKRIKHVGHVFVQTDDGTLYVKSDGGDLRGTQQIIPVTNEHRYASTQKTPFWSPYSSVPQGRTQPSFKPRARLLSTLLAHCERRAGQLISPLPHGAYSP